MITKSDIIKIVEKDGRCFIEDDYVVNKKDGMKLFTIDDFTEKVKEDLGVSFECIHEDHVGLKTVLRCKKCGTVIFTSNAEDFEPDFRCPVCTDHPTHFEFWTKEEIESDKKKQGTISYFQDWTDWENNYYSRREKRHGKLDDEFLVKDIRTKKHMLIVSLKCFNITESYFKGLHLKFEFWKKSDNELGHTYDKGYCIPLSVSYYHFWKQYKKSQAIS